MPTSDNSDVVVEVCGSLLYLVQHCPHHGPGANVAAVLPLLLQFGPINTSGFSRDSNQYSMAEPNLASHPVAGIGTHTPLIRGKQCIHTATMTERLHLTYPCRYGDLNPRPSHKRESAHTLSMHGHNYLDGSWELFISFPDIYTLSLIHI